MVRQRNPLKPHRIRHPNLGAGGLIGKARQYREISDGNPAADEYLLRRGSVGLSASDGVTLPPVPESVIDFHISDQVIVNFSSSINGGLDTAHWKVISQGRFETTVDAFGGTFDPTEIVIQYTALGTKDPPERLEYDPLAGSDPIFDANTGLAVLAFSVPTVLSPGFG